MPGPAIVRQYLKRTEQMAKRYGLGFLHRITMPVRLTDQRKTVEQYFQQEDSLRDKLHVVNGVRTLFNRIPPKAADVDISAFGCEGIQTCPPRFVASLAAGRVFGRGNVVTANDTLLQDVSIDFAEVIHERQSNLQFCRLPKSKRFSSSLGVLATRGAANYYHWVFDVLPRFDILKGVAVDAFYVDYQKRFQKEYLSLLGINRSQVVQASRYSHWRAEQLVVPSFSGSAGCIPQESVNFLRRLIPKTSGTGGDRPSRLYVSRGDAKRRRLVNEPEVIDAVKRWGFTPVTLAGKSVLAQIELFANAKFVIGAHGAGLSNLVYCSPETKVLEIFAPLYVNACYWGLAQRCDHDYRYMVGALPVTNLGRVGMNNSAHNGDHIRVDLQVLNEQISLATKGAETGS